MIEEEELNDQESPDSYAPSGPSLDSSSVSTSDSPVTTGAATLSSSATIDSPAYSSSTSGENALRVTDGVISLNSGSVNKSGSASSPVDNAAVLVTAGTLTLNGTEVISSASSSPAVALAQLSSDDPDAISTLTISNAYLEVASGDTLYITNTTADLTLSSSKFVNRDPSSNFLRAEASPLGDYGINGGHARVSLVNQVIEGNITADSASSVSLSFAQSYYMGALNPADSARSFSVALDATSNLILAGDSYLTELVNADPDNMNIYSNGYKLFVAGEELQINGSEAPTLPESETKSAGTTPEPVVEETVEDTRIKCGPGSPNGLKGCDTSGPNILFFILGGILISLAIVVPILIIKRKKEK